MSNSNLIDELFRTVEAIGVDNTLKTLRQAQFQEVKFDDKRVEAVVTLVSKKTSVPAYEILFGVGRKNERKYAIGFCAFYLHSPSFFNIDMEIVTDFLKKDQNLLYKYSKLVQKLNPNHTNDKKFFDWKRELDSEVNKHAKK